MRADREAMRLVAQPFDEIKHRIARLEFEWVAPGQEKGLHAPVPIRALSNRNDRVAALDVAIVVALDTSWGSRQTENLGQHFEELALGRALGKLARQRLARIGERVIDQVLFLAPLRNAHLDLVSALGG